MQRALAAARFARSAEMLAGVNNQSVEFIIQGAVGSQVELEELPEILVTELGRSESVAFEHAAGVGVDNEDGTFSRVEKDGVGGFGADADHREQLIAQSGRGSAKHFGERALVFAAKKADEIFQFFCFLAVAAGGANEAGQARRPASEVSRGADFRWHARRWSTKCFEPGWRRR
jgi:hypothetical protein